jgi:hypothetical protein
MPPFGNVPQPQRIIEPDFDLSPDGEYGPRGDGSQGSHSSFGPRSPLDANGLKNREHPFQSTLSAEEIQHGMEVLKSSCREIPTTNILNL